MTDYDAGIGVALILLSFIALIIFIAKWQPVFSPYRPTTDDVPEVAMVGVKLPVTIQVIDVENASFTGGVKVRLKTEHMSMLHTFWGVEWASLRQLIQNNPLQLIQQGNTLLQDKCLAKNEALCFQEDSDEELVIRIPNEADHFSLGPPPRSRYPLCILIRSRPPDVSTTQPCVIGSIVLIHVPDTALQEKCHIISHILVTNRGQAHYLQPDETFGHLSEVGHLLEVGQRDVLDIATSMFMASDSQRNELSSHLEQRSSERTHCDIHCMPEDATYPVIDGETHPKTDREKDDNEGVQRDCTVCQNAPIARVILPCRHACVCHSCFPLLNRCPMCRGVIYSFFSMATAHRGENLPDTADKQRDWMSQIENGCERLNQWLGVH